MNDSGNAVFIFCLVILVGFRVSMTYWYHYQKMVEAQLHVHTGTIGMRAEDPYLVRKAEKARKSFIRSMLFTIIVIVLSAIAIALVLSGKL